MKIGVMNGPNLGRLGERSPEIYGPTTLDQVQQELQRAYATVQFSFFQSNHEGALIDCLETWQRHGVGDVVLNPGALAHQSYALRDAIEGLSLRVVEVHISNVYRRAPFRSRSLTAPACLGVIAGLGVHGYRLAVAHLLFLADQPEM